MTRGTLRFVRAIPRTPNTEIRAFLGFEAAEMSQNAPPRPASSLTTAELLAAGVRPTSLLLRVYRRQESGRLTPAVSRVTVPLHTVDDLISLLEHVRETTDRRQERAR